MAIFVTGIKRVVNTVTRVIFLVTFFSAILRLLPSDPATSADFKAALTEFDRAWEQELLTRLVALNAQRAAEESKGQIRYLRPEYQRKKEGGGNLKPET